MGVNKVNLSVKLIKEKLREADEVKKASAEKMKMRNSKSKKIENPNAAVSRSERFDTIKQVEQDKKFTSDIAPKASKMDIVPQADFAGNYTEKMPHGQSAGMGKGENDKSPKITKSTTMNPNQTSKFKKVGNDWGKVTKTEDDGSKETYRLPAADYATSYTDKMKHGVGPASDTDGSDGAPSKRKFGTLKGGPTRKGGQRKASFKDAPVKNIKQVDGPKKETSPKDALTWGSHKFDKNTHNASNIYEDIHTGVGIEINGKRKASFEIVSESILSKMVENYNNHGYNAKVVKTEAKWKSDAKFIKLVRESIHAKHNNLISESRKLRKQALRRFGQICQESYNENLYESNHRNFVAVVGNAFKKIEKLAEDKYINSLEFFDCTCRILSEGDIVELEIMTHATDKDMAARQVTTKVLEEYGLETEIKHIFVDGEKIK